MLASFFLSIVLGLDDSRPESHQAEKKIEKSVLSIDEQYVRENLERCLHPTKIEFLEGGQVKLEFDFKEKSPRHEAIFTPAIGKDLKDTFRWTARGEEGRGYGPQGGGPKKGRDEFIGLKISNSGMAHLSLWFKDDVEAEFAFVQNGTSSPRHAAAVIFTNAAGSSIGSNLGSQCASYIQGKLEKCAGTVEPIPTGNTVKIKLVVRSGTFESYRDGQLAQKMPYSMKTFSSGHLGFLWAGGIGGLIQKLEIKGAIDVKKVAEELRKSGK
jgi:hypothetical protein